LIYYYFVGLYQATTALNYGYGETLKPKW